MSRGLIVTADDFGAAAEVNEAVEIAHRQGVLTAASLMVAAPAAADAAARARTMPALRVGLHLVLTDGRPARPPAVISALVDRRGRFHDNMAGAGAKMFFDPTARRQLADEITAQFEAFAATGLVLDHVNAHKHFHLHPTIGGLILKIGRRFGLRAVRAPIEPAQILSRIEPFSVWGTQPAFNIWAALARKRFRTAGLMVPDRVFGLRWSGAMSTFRVRALVEALPPGLTEIYLHPATSGGFEGSAPGYRYADELAALIDREVIGSAGRDTIRMGGFLDFAV